MKKILGIRFKKNTPRSKKPNVVFFSFSESDRTFVLDLKHKAMGPKYPGLKFLVQDLVKHQGTDESETTTLTNARSLKGVSRTIVFVGKDTYKSAWVAEEVRMTLKMRKPVYAIRVKGTHGVKPVCLSENRIHLYPWHEENLQYLATRED